MSVMELKKKKAYFANEIKKINKELKKRPITPSYSINIRKKNKKYYVYLKYSLNNRKISKYMGDISEETYEKILLIDSEAAKKYLSKIKLIFEKKPN